MSSARLCIFAIASLMLANMMLPGSGQAQAAPGARPAASVPVAASPASSIPASASSGSSNAALSNAATVGGEESEEPPPVMGFNFTINSNTQHSSVTGWSSSLTPGLSYRWNKHFSADIDVPWYLSVKNYVKTTKGGTTTYPLLGTNNVIGDTVGNGHLSLSSGDLSYEANVSVGFATGDAAYGLSANTTTFNITNHFDYSIGPFDPDVELGEGNSSSLAGRTVKKSYTAVGPIANFQLGTSIDLPWELSLDLEAYENLPIGNQNVYGTVTKKGKNGKTNTKQVLEGTGVAEDNGFTAEFDIPLGPSLTLAGNYARSLIQATDTAGISITWTLRTPKKQHSAAK